MISIGASLSRRMLCYVKLHDDTKVAFPHVFECLLSMNPDVLENIRILQPVQR